MVATLCIQYMACTVSRCCQWGSKLTWHDTNVIARYTLTMHIAHKEFKPFFASSLAAEQACTLQADASWKDQVAAVMRQLQVEQQNAATSRALASEAASRATIAEAQLMQEAKAAGGLRTDVERWTSEAESLQGQLKGLRDQLLASHNHASALQQDKNGLEAQVEALQQQSESSQTSTQAEKALLKV